MDQQIAVSGCPRVVVLGAGYAGLMAALRLSRQAPHTQVTVVAANPLFEQRIRLQQLAVGQELPTRPVSAFFKGTGVRFRHGRVTEIAAEARRLDFDDGSCIAYDYLVYAPGSTVDRDSVPGVRAHCLTLDSATVATARDALAALAARGGQVAICGTGLTGIETATEIAESFPSLHVTLLGKGRIGAGFSTSAMFHLGRAFERLEIGILDECSVRAVTATHVQTDQGELPFDLCLWAGGFAVPELARAAKLAVDARGRLLLDATLRARGRSEIFGAGDAVAVEGHHGSPISMSCKMALPLGAHAAENLASHLRGLALEPFNYRDTGVCVSLGRRDGIVQTARKNGSPGYAFTGRPAAWIKEFICRSTLRWLDAERRGKAYRWQHVPVPQLEGTRPADNFAA